MKILVCTFSFPYFKDNIFDARFVYSEVIAYAENGAEVVVLTPHFVDATEKELINPQITVIRFPYFLPKKLQIVRKPGKPIYDSNSILALMQLPILCLVFMVNIIKYARHVDIIHSQWTPTALLALPAKWILDKKLVMTARGSDYRLLPKWLNKFIFNNVDASIDCFGPTEWNINNRITYPSNYIKLPLLVHDDSINDPPEEINNLLKTDPDIFIILYVGRFHKFKIEYAKQPLFNLIYACNTLRENINNIHIMYLGDGDNNIINKMEKLITENGLSNHISLIGAKTNVMDYIRHCSLGVGGSVFNSVSQEFTISKKPQLIMNTPDNENTPWKDSINCIFIEPEDKDDLINKIKWAYDNTEIINQIGEKAASDMAEFFVESREGGKYYLDAFKSI